MKRLMSINRDLNIQVSSRATNFLMPKNIYLPISSLEENYIKNDNVKKDEILFKNNNKLFFSPISGKIKGIYKKQYLVIANNYKEEKISKTRLKIDNINKLKEIINKYANPLNFLFDKYSNKTLYYVAFVDDPYDVSLEFFINDYKNEILDVLDILRQLLHMDNVKIILKDTNTLSIDNFNMILGMYPFISLMCVPDKYPIGDLEILKDYVSLDGALVIKGQELKILIDIIINNSYNGKTYVTLSGKDIKTPQVIKTIIGTSLKEIISELNILVNTDMVYVNGFLKGHKEKIDDVIITDDISLLFFLNEEKEETPCINCGKCILVCPKGCEPILNKKMDNCLHCGLCSYVCPSHINFGKER